MNHFKCLFSLSLIPPSLPVFPLNTYFHRPQSLIISSLNHSPNHTASYSYPLGLFSSLCAHPISKPLAPFLESCFSFPPNFILPQILIHSTYPSSPSTLATTEWCMSHVDVLFSWVSSGSSLKWLFFQVWGGDALELMLTYCSIDGMPSSRAHVINGHISYDLSPDRGFYLSWSMQNRSYMYAKWQSVCGAGVCAHMLVCTDVQAHKGTNDPVFATGLCLFVFRFSLI